jgi:hypothetical protein
MATTGSARTQNRAAPATSRGSTTAALNWARVGSAARLGFAKEVVVMATPLFELRNYTLYSSRLYAVELLIPDRHGNVSAARI